MVVYLCVICGVICGVKCVCLNAALDRSRGGGLVVARLRGAGDCRRPRVRPRGVRLRVRPRGVRQLAGAAECSVPDLLGRLPGGRARPPARVRTQGPQ